MKEWIEKIINSKPVKVLSAFVVFFGWCSAFATCIALPIRTGYWYWAIPITIAVIIALPYYIKGIKWAIK